MQTETLSTRVPPGVAAAVRAAAEADDKTLSTALRHLLTEALAARAAAAR
jgi:hypothetical protein